MKRARQGTESVRQRLVSQCEDWQEQWQDVVRARGERAQVFLTRQQLLKQRRAGHGWAGVRLRGKEGLGKAVHATVPGERKKSSTLSERSQRMRLDGQWGLSQRQTQDPDLSGCLEAIAMDGGGGRWRVVRSGRC